METQVEIDFHSKLNENFPFHDKQKFQELIEEAALISDNSLFIIIEKLIDAHDKDNSSKTANTLIELLELVGKSINHPLKELVLKTAYRMIVEVELSDDEAINGMRIVSKYPGQWAALSILYFSCIDVFGEVEYVWNEIVAQWNSEV